MRRANEGVNQTDRIKVENKHDRCIFIQGFVRVINLPLKIKRLHMLVDTRHSRYLSNGLNLELCDAEGRGRGGSKGR